MTTSSGGGWGRQHRRRSMFLLSCWWCWWHAVLPIAMWCCLGGLSPLLLGSRERWGQGWKLNSRSKSGVGRRCSQAPGNREPPCFLLSLLSELQSFNRWGAFLMSRKKRGKKKEFSQLFIGASWCLTSHLCCRLPPPTTTVKWTGLSGKAEWKILNLWNNRDGFESHLCTLYQLLPSLRLSNRAMTDNRLVRGK